MPLCSWCRVEYNSTPLFHVCQDGTTFAQRIVKSEEDYKEEYGRQERLRAGYRAMKEEVVPNSQAIVPVAGSDKRLPEQPITKGTLFQWNYHDLDFARKARIKLTGGPNDKN